MKRIIAIFITVVMLLTSIPTQAFCVALKPANTLEESEFSEQLSELLRTYNDDYFGQITIDVQNNTIQQDDKEEVSLDKYNIDYSQVATYEPVIPAVAVLDTIGEKSSFDEESAEVIVDGESYSFSDTSLVEEGKVLENNGGVLTVENDSKIYSLPAAYMNEEQAKENFALDMDYADGKITITAPYQTKRLIVQCNGKLKKSFGAVEVLTRNDGYSVLQFDSEEKTAEAEKAIAKQNNVQYVTIDNAVVVSSYITKRNGAKQIGSDRYKTYLAENAKDTEITVAVADTGVDTEHEMLKDRCVRGYNVYTENDYVKDKHGHGTHCAGIIVDNTPENVKIMPIKVLTDEGNGTGLSIAAGIDKAVELGAKIINMSFGGLTDDMTNNPISLAVRRAYNAGVCLVCSSGNNFGNTKNYTPAGVEECITVASVRTNTYSVSTFSNFGNTVDIAAPGEEILSSVPNNSYAQMSGTSMACPFVVAATAMFLTNDPSLTPAQLEQQVKSTATDMLTEGWDIYSGVGILNFGRFFGDENYPSGIKTSDKEIHLTAFSKATGYYLRPVIQFDLDNGKYLTDATFSVDSTNPDVAEFKGRHIAPKNEGEATITLNTKNGKSYSFVIFCEKKEVWIDSAAKNYAGGNGTKSSPYLISNAEQLSKFALDTRNGVPTNGKYYKLTKDIDLSGKDWISIVYLVETESILGTGYSWSFKGFDGNFDGNNHKIKNMCVFSDPIKAAWEDKRPLNALWYKNNDGLFSHLRGAQVRNLGIENATVLSTNSGILCSAVMSDSTNTGTVIENVYTSGFSAGNGLFGSTLDGKSKFKNCFSNATVLGSGICSNINSPEYLGCEFRNVFFCGDYYDIDTVKTNSGFLSYTEGSKDYKTTRYYNCFSAATPESGIGFAKDSIYSYYYNCYYNSANTYGIQNNKGSNKPSPKAAANFKSKAFFTNASNWNKESLWDFTNTWAINANINNGYPYLKNIKPENIKSSSTNSWLDYAAENFAGGNGTKENPYRIENAEQLAKIAQFYRFGGGKNKYFSIEKDIDLSAHNWYPIGAGSNIDQREGDVLDITTHRYFLGNINGNSHTIKGLHVQSTGDSSAFISMLDSGSVVNLNFEDADINAYRYAGIVCGKISHNATIANVSVSGSVTALEGIAGGICGKSVMPSSIKGCKAKVSVTSKNIDKTASNYSGGIVGMNGAIVEQCYVQNGTVLNGTVGAISGNNRGVLQNCYSDSSYVLSKAGSYLCNMQRCCAELINGKYNLIKFSSNYYNKKTTVTKNNITLGNLEGFDTENIWQLNSKELTLRNCEPYEYPQNNLPTTFWSDYKAKSFAGGTGTFADPYLIETAEQLALMLSDYTKAKDRAYKLMNDIDLSAHLWDSEVPLPNLTISAYRVDFDGNNHTIKNIFFGDNGAGLFPFINFGNIFNLTVDTIKGNTCCGILYELYNGGCIYNCHVKNALITNSVTYSFPIAPSFAGGICTENNQGTIERCSFEGKVYGENSASGISGNNQSAVIKNCFTIGHFLCSTGANSIAHNSYGNSTIEYNYSVLTDVSWAVSEKNCIIAADNVDPSYSYLVINTQQLKKQETFEGWDFDEVWEINPEANNGLPYYKATPERNVTYQTNGGELPDSAPSKYKVFHAFTLPTPVKNGYRFDGWFYDEHFNEPAQNIQGRGDFGELKFYAKWTPVYSVEYNANGAKGSMQTQVMEVSKEVKLNKNSFTKTGYVFQGWSTSPKGKVIYSNTQTVKDITAQGETLTLYAIWKPITYNIMFYNGFSGSKKKTIVQKNFVYDKSAKLRKNSFKYLNKGKYVLGGWQNTATGKIYADTQSVKNLSDKNGATVVLKAYWVADKAYKIQYNLNGGKLPKNAKLSIRPGRGYYKLPTPTRKGYVFDGWYRTKKFTGNKTIYVAPWIKGNIALFAKWKKK